MESDDRPADESDPIAVAWEKVDLAWDEDREHERLLELARVVDRLADVARLYREARERPERRARAERQLDRLLAIALSNLVRTPEARLEAPRKRVVAFGYVLAIVLVAAFAYLLLRPQQ